MFFREMLDPRDELSDSKLAYGHSGIIYATDKVSGSVNDRRGFRNILLSRIEGGEREAKFSF